MPASYRPHTSLAEGDLDTARRETDLTLAILNPLPDRWNTPIPYINAGKVYSDAGDSRKAVDLLLRAQRIHAALDPAKQWFVLDAQLGHDYLRTGQFGSSVDAFERALRLRFAPELVGELAAAAQAQGDPRRAAIALFEALEATQNTKYAGDLVVEWACDYGENVWRVLVTLFVIYLLFVPVYAVTDAVVRVEETPTGKAKTPTHDLVDLALYSLTAMTAPGNPPEDLLPRDALAYLLTGVQTLLSIFLTGLMGFVAGNRIHR